MSVKNGVIMGEDKKNVVHAFQEKVTELKRVLLRLYLQYVNPRLAKVIEAVSDPKAFLSELLPDDTGKWLTIALAVTGLLVLVMPERFWGWQIFIFLGIFLLGFRVVRVLQSMRSTFYNLLVAYPGKHLLQEIIVLEKPITGGSAEVVLHGETWRLSGPDCPAGSRVRVVAIKENVLFVSRIDQ